MEGGRVGGREIEIKELAEEYQKPHCLILSVSHKSGRGTFSCMIGPVPPPCQPGMETARVWGGGGRWDGVCRAKGNGVRMRTCWHVSLQT